MFKGIFKSIIAAAAGMGIARVSSGFERNNGESLGHCVYGSEATGDFQKKLKIYRNKLAFIQLYASPQRNFELRSFDQSFSIMR